MIAQDLHLRAALSEPENSGRVHRPDPRSDNGQRHRAEFEDGIVKSAEPRIFNARSRAASKSTAGDQSCIISGL
jgi:hypothetical protein